MKSSASALVNFCYFVIIGYCGGIRGEGPDLTSPFNLPLCCFNAETSQLQFTDSQVLASNSNSESQIGDSSKNQPKLYKIVIPFNSTLQILTLKSKRSSGNGESTKIKFPTDNSFDNVVEPEKIISSPQPLPNNWTEQLRQALHDGLSKFNNWTAPPGENSTLWKLLKVAPLEVIDPLTRSVSGIQSAPDTISQPKFSGIMVSTPKGVEIRTQASAASNSVHYPYADTASGCDCPLIQRGDLVLAYWSVNNHPSDGAVEYQVYPLPHNVPTPPIFIPFIPDLSFKASPLDLTPGIGQVLHPEQHHNYLDQGISPGQSLRKINHPPHVNYNPGVQFLAHVNPPELDRSILVETSEGYTPGFLDWYRGVLNEQFRIPYFPLGHQHHHHHHHLPPLQPPPIPNFVPNLANIGHADPGPGPGPGFRLNSPEIPPSSLPGAMPIPSPVPELGFPQLPPSLQPGPPFPSQDQVFPGISNIQTQMQEMTPGLGGNPQQLPLPLPAPESPSLPSPPLIFQHPKSIQEIISGNVLEDDKKIPLKRRVNRDCRNGPGSVSNSNMAQGCRKSRAEQNTDRNYQKPYSSLRQNLSYHSTEKIAKEEKPTTPAAVTNSNSRESSYILNF